VLSYSMITCPLYKEQGVVLGSILARLVITGGNQA